MKIMRLLFFRNSACFDGPEYRCNVYTLLLIIVLTCLITESYATTFTCEAPKKGGKFTISLKSLNAKCEGIVVQIPNGSTAAQKATLIANWINASCAGVFTASATNGEVTVSNGANPGMRVFLKFGTDETGEKDAIEKALQPSWWEIWKTSPIYTCAGTASGISVDGTSAGKIHIGTSTCMAEVTTHPGQTPFSILNDARMQLINNGVQDVFLSEVSPGVWGLSFKVQLTDTFVKFGDDDTGTECTFEMFEPPVPTFHQLSFDYDGTITNHSEWGAVDLQFIGFENIMYLNLTIDTAWVIENMPVVTTRGYGVVQSQRFWFDLGDAGFPVSTVLYGLSLSPTVSGKPTATATAPVYQDQVTIYSGLEGLGTGGGGPEPAEKQKGGQAANPVPKTHLNFPNQESPVNFCVPAGVSNSLQWLNTKNNLGMQANDISIPTLAGAFGTTPGNGTVTNTIYPNKKAYCKKKKLPITTRKFSGNRIGDIVNEIKNGQDVELMVKWKGQGGKGHCVAITGITSLGNGKYALVITHDKEQGVNGGTVDENATYDKNTKKWGGALSKASGQSGDIIFMVECPLVKSKQTSYHLPGGISHRMVQDAVVTYDQGKYQIRNLVLADYPNNVTPPGYGDMIIFSMESMATFEFSSDSGSSFQPHNAGCMLMCRAIHALDSAGREYFPTEILQMQLQGGSLPPTTIVRESNLPPDSSTGLLTFREVPGGYQIASFFDVFTELSVDGGMSWLPDDEETTVLYADGPAVLPVLNLENKFFEGPYSTCFDATETITTGGTAPFMVFWGANITLVAGQSIHMLPGTAVSEGGYFHAYISQNGLYCPDEEILLLETATLNADESEASEKPFPGISIRPNPVSESFVVEVNGENGELLAEITVLDIHGKAVVAKLPVAAYRHTISTDGWRPGLYFVQVKTTSESRILKIVKL